MTSTKKKLSRLEAFAASLEQRNLDPSLDEWFPYCGPCLICGGPDARHRVWDGLIGRFNGGETWKFIAQDCDLPYEAILALRRSKYRRGCFLSESRLSETDHV